MTHLDIFIRGESCLLILPRNLLEIWFIQNWMHAKLLEQGELIRNAPVLDDFVLRKPVDIHLFDLHGFSSGRDPIKVFAVSPIHGDSHPHLISLGSNILDIEFDVRESAAQ